MVTIWIFTDRGFVSLVVDKRDPDMLQVRARLASDITDNFPDAEVYTRDGADYRYRARIKKSVVAVALAQKILDMDYLGHFKDVALRRSEPATGRSTAYYAVWGAMGKLQDYAPYSRVPRGQETWKSPGWGGPTTTRQGLYGADTGAGYVYSGRPSGWGSFGLQDPEDDASLDDGVDLDSPDLEFEVTDALQDLETKHGLSYLEQLSADEWEELLVQTVRDNRIKQAEKDRNFFNQALFSHPETPEPETPEPRQHPSGGHSRGSRRRARRNRARNRRRN